MKRPRAPSGASPGDFCWRAAGHGAGPRAGHPAETAPAGVMRWMTRLAAPELQSCHTMNTPPAPSASIATLFCSPLVVHTGLPLFSQAAEVGGGQTNESDRKVAAKKRKRGKTVLRSETATDAPKDVGGTERQQL